MTLIYICLEISFLATAYLFGRWHDFHAGCFMFSLLNSLLAFRHFVDAQYWERKLNELRSDRIDRLYGLGKPSSADCCNESAKGAPK